VKAIRLKEQVKRNVERSPENFMFQLTDEETEIMVSQNAIPSKKHLGGFLPYAFTEHGVLMLASVLKSERAMQMSIRIIEVFIKMREILLAHKDILLQLEKIETKLTGHDEDIQLIFKYLKQLLNPPQKPRQKIGFKRSNEVQIYAVGQSVPLGRPKQHVRIRTIGSSDSFSCTLAKRAFIPSYDEPTFILPGPEAPFLVASELALRFFRFFLPRTLQGI
jgi:hypothetical protein